MQWFLGRFPGAVAGVANAARALVVGNRRSSVASEIYREHAFRRRLSVILVRRDRNNFCLGGEIHDTALRGLLLKWNRPHEIIPSLELWVLTFRAESYAT